MTLSSKASCLSLDLRMPISGACELVAVMFYTQVMVYTLSRENERVAACDNLPDVVKSAVASEALQKKGWAGSQR